MADMRRRSPEPPPGAPQIQFKPGIAQEMLRELAPLLAEEGIDVDNIDVPDLDTLQAATGPPRTGQTRPAGSAGQHRPCSGRRMRSASRRMIPARRTARARSGPAGFPDRLSTGTW
jgi:hypothetical protein